MGNIMAKTTKTEKTTNIETEERTVSKLTIEQEINLLAQAHRYFSDFDGVKGSQTANFSRVLDALAMVVNSLVLKQEESK